MGVNQIKTFSEMVSDGGNFFRFPPSEYMQPERLRERTKKHMKKLIALLLMILIMLSAASAEDSRHLSGGWEPSADPAVTEELKALFDRGTDALTGMSYIPVAYLGSQIVAGTNHAFLCQAVTAYPGMDMDPEPAYTIVYLYEDLSGHVSILSIANFDIGSLCQY